MATPWSDPRTGRLYLRRQIPAQLRPFFGGRAIYKKTLGTKAADEARSAFTRENAILEDRLAAARKALSDGHGAPDPSGIVRRWFSGAAVDKALGGQQRLMLALMQLDAQAIDWMGEFWRDGMLAPLDTDWQAVAHDRDCFDQMLCNFYRDDVTRIGIAWESMRMDESLQAQCRSFVDALLPALRAFNIEAIDYTDAPLGDAILARIDIERSGKLADIIKRDGENKRERPRMTRQRPTMRVRELFREWKSGNDPRPQTALEYEAAVDDFIEFANDPAIAAIDADLIYDYRDAAATLPASMPRTDRTLPFTARVAKHVITEPKPSAATLKKRVGAIQALLTYAHQQRWVGENTGRGVQIVGYTKAQRNRRSFQDHELSALFSAPLFTDPATWDDGAARAIDETLFWTFMIGLTSGARLEEVGQAAIADVKQDGSVVYFDIDDTALSEGVGKHVKTLESKRMVPIHDRLIQLGFLRYRDAMASAGHTELFPALEANSVGKRTKELSRRANRLIDRQVGSDARLVFHSLRHTFKAKGNDAGLNDRTLDQICGHAPVSTGGRYGSDPRILTIHRELHAIDFACIDWDAIMRARASHRS
ncbi:DUF6538 domain-containing protein [Sphingomonas sp. PWP1-2]|uniref:DUF6538 domain-containing protein n=1 Tax=Sphingomonas sp. PWP1-2 TaxID=2804558 RepID=UPI003CEC2D4F